MVALSDASSVSPFADPKVNASALGNPPEFSRRCDPRRYRALYPDLWCAFLHSHFRDATHVAYFFSVDPKTARDWWEGVSRSQGWAVAYAIEMIPTAAQFLRAA